MMKKVPFVNTTRPLPELMPSPFAPFQIQMLMLSGEEKSPFPFKRRVVECKSILDKIPLLKLYILACLKGDETNRISAT